jgi:superfamily II DNA or RNA helicase
LVRKSLGPKGLCRFKSGRPHQTIYLRTRAANNEKRQKRQLRLECIMTSWHLQLEPREWQKTAFERWRESKRGIIQVVTGGGKTAFAQICLLDFFRDCPNAQALIVVPTISLLDQWWLALQDELNVSPDQIGLLSGQEKPIGDEPIIIAVINSSRNFTAPFTKGRTVFLIVDECHRAGSPINSKALDGTFAATLGLSATPEREYDEGFIHLLQPRLGPIIYKYSYVDAARDGIISPFSLTNINVELLEDEERKYRSFTKSIARYLSVADRDEEKVKRLLQQRAAVSGNATMRVPVAAKIVEAHRGERAIVFHERIDAANHILDVLRQRGHRATAYHSDLGPAVRRDNLRLFRKGLFDVLVCCRALDEGINVPEASVAVIASSTSSQRQRIQRLGRILRKAKGKESATVYTLYATAEEEKRLRREEQNLEGVTAVTWQRGRVQSHA